MIGRDGSKMDHKSNTPIDIVKQNERVNNANDKFNIVNKMNGDKQDIIEDPLVKCNIDWIKEGEKFMQKREMKLQQTEISDKSYRPEEKDNISKKLANNGKNSYCIYA